MGRNQFAFLVLASFSLTNMASATIVAGPTIGGLRTFTDTNTGRNWLRLDTFFFQTQLAMVATATNAGFVFAQRPDVDALLNSLPLSGGQFATYKSIMGDAPNREIIYGAYAIPTAQHLTHIAFARDTSTSWGFEENVPISPTTVVNGNYPPSEPFQDMNIWAYAGPTTGGVPEPASWAMLLGGFALTGLMARRRRRSIAA